MIIKLISLNHKKQHIQELLQDVNVSFTIIIEHINKNYIFNIYSRTKWISQQFGILTMPEIIDKITILVNNNNEFLAESAKISQPSEKDLEEMFKSAIEEEETNF